MKPLRGGPAGITRSTSESCFISLLTEQGNQDGFTINGNATLINSSVFNIVPGSQNEYITATIEFSESILPVNQPFWITNTKGNFQVSMLNGENISGSRFAVFGDYVLDIIEASSQVLTKKQISVYPNPAKNDLILEIERAQYDQPVLILTDLTGKKVKEITLQQNHTQVDLSKFVAGIYLYFIVDQGARQRAVEVFSQLRVWDTEHNSGVLVYVQLVDRKVEILADRGLSARVPQAEWEDICRQLEQSYRKGEFENGSVAAIGEISEHLARHFPSRESNPNELPNRPVVL